MTPAPYLSIIIPTFQRDRVLIETIQSVLDQMHPSSEIIVVDQSTDHDAATKKAIAAYRQNGQIVYLKERIANLPRARNVGASNARGEILVFIDDDVILTKNYLRHITKAFNDTDLDAMTGRIMAPGEEELNLHPFPMSHKKAAERLDLPICVYTGVLQQPAHFFGGNCAIRRDAYFFAGGFNHHFSRSALGEDIEFNGRLQRLGGRVRYDSRMALWHLSEPSGGCRLAPEQEYRRHRDRLRCYYYALLNGLGLKRALPAIKHRFHKSDSIRKPILQSSPNTSVSPLIKARRALGRLVGGALGIYDAVAKKRQYGNIADVYLSRKRINAGSIDVVIATYERPEDILRTVNHFLLYRHSFEKIIVIDQSTEPNTALLKIQEQQPDKLLYVREEIAGASRARNIGAALSTSENLLFVDDDISLIDDLVKTHTPKLEKNAVVGGRIAWTEEAAKNPAPYPGTIQSDVEKWESPICYYGTPAKNPLHIITCNMSLVRDIVAMCGGFHEWFRGGGEDLDFVQRVRRRKLPVEYHPDAVVIHHSQDSGGTRPNGEKAFTRLYKKYLAFLVSVNRCNGFLGMVAFLYRRLRNQVRRTGNKELPMHSQKRSTRTKNRWLGKALEWIAIVVAIPPSLLISFPMNRHSESYLATARNHRRTMP